MSETGNSDEEIARETEQEIRERFCNAVSEAGQNSVVYPTFEEIQLIILSALREARQQGVSSDTLTPQDEAKSGIQAEFSDTERLTFLDKNDGDITFHEGDIECGYLPGWEVKVTVSGKVLSGVGHSIREAIDDAARDLSPDVKEDRR